MKYLSLWIFLVFSLFSLPSFAQDIIVEPGDVINLNFPGEKDFTGIFSVGSDGTLLLPEVGEVQVGGKPWPEAEASIRNALQKVFVQVAGLKIDLKKQRNLVVQVLGAVKKPGQYDLPSNANLAMAVGAAEGVNEGAQTTKVEVQRQAAKKPVNYQNYLENGNPQALPMLQSGDTIFIPSKPTARIIGGVQKPGQYPIAEQDSLLDILSQAGGANPNADLSHVRILQHAPNGQMLSPVIFNLQHFLKYGGSRASLPKLANGDIVEVPEIIGDNSDKASWLHQSPNDSIYVFGQVGKPGRYRFNQEMSFIDILAQADGPGVDADINDIRVIHGANGMQKISTVNLSLYFKTGDKALLPTVIPGDAIYVPSSKRPYLDQSKEETVRVLGAVKSPGRYRYNDSMTILDVLAEAGGPTDTAYLERIVVLNISNVDHRASTFNMVNFAQTGNPALLPILRAGDTVFVPDYTKSNWQRFMKGINDLSSVLVVLKIAAVI